MAFTPHVRSCPGLYRSVLSGMANSASHPRSVVWVRTVQSASQFRLKPSRSPWPAGLPPDLAVVLDAERIGAEDERVLTVVERVEQDLNRIGVVEVGVATTLAHDDVVGLGVEADDADVEILAIEQKPDLGSLGGGLTLVRPLLDEPAEGIRVRPARLIDVPVDDWLLALAELVHYQLRGGGNRLCCRKRHVPGADDGD